MKKSFTFLKRRLLVNVAFLLDYKWLLKARNVDYDFRLWKKGIYKAQKVFQGF
jgi:hypothetical protein